MLIAGSRGVNKNLSLDSGNVKGARRSPKSSYVALRAGRMSRKQKTGDGNGPAGAQLRVERISVPNVRPVRV